MTTNDKTSSTRKSASVVGVLYIVATVAGVLTLAPLGALLEGPGILANAASTILYMNCAIHGD